MLGTRHRSAVGEDRVAFTQEGEIHFIGQTKLDNGTSVGLTVELEAWNPSSRCDGRRQH